jgi:WD40 repeat protein
LLDEVRAPLTKGIKHVAISADNSNVGASDMSNDHNIAVFDISPNKKLTKKAFGKGCPADIMSLGFSPIGDSLVATCIKEVRFFHWANGVIKSNLGSGWGKMPADAILCQAVVGDTLFTGSASGEIITWKGSSISSRQKIHEKKVNALYSDGKTLVSGGADGKIHIFLHPEKVSLKFDK